MGGGWWDARNAKTPRLKTMVGEYVASSELFGGHRSHTRCNHGGCGMPLGPQRLLPLARLGPFLPVPAFLFAPPVTCSSFLPSPALRPAATLCARQIPVSSWFSYYPSLVHPLLCMLTCLVYHPSDPITFLRRQVSMVPFPIHPFTSPKVPWP